VSEKSVVAGTPPYYCFTVLTGDFDDDGWPDLYVACDSTPSMLFHNNHDGTFTERAVAAGVAYNEDGREQAGMGTDAADYDGDGWLDIVKTNFSDDTSTLYHNNHDGTFSDVTFSAGLGKNTQFLGWGTLFLDIDNDGWPDLFIANGHVYPEVDGRGLNTPFRERKVLYWNEHNGKFSDISLNAGPGIVATFPVQRRSPTVRAQRIEAQRQPQLGSIVSAIGDELGEFAVGHRPRSRVHPVAHQFPPGSAAQAPPRWPFRR